MRKQLLTCLWFACMAIFVVSCSSSVPKQASFIPKDAFMVMDFNTASLAEKCKKGNINWDSLFTNALKDADSDKASALKTQFSKMTEAGIDFGDHIFSFVKMASSMMTGQNVTVGLVAGMKDAAKFETYIKSQKDVTPIQKKDTYSYTVLNNEVGIGWNKDVAILVYATPPQARNADEVAPNDGKASLDALDQLMHLKKEEAIVAIDDFKTLMKEKADILYWSNSEGIVSSIPLVGMTKLGDLFKGMYTAGTLNFEDGKAVASVKSYFGKDLADILKKYPSPNADMAMVNMYPSPLLGYMNISFNPNVLLDIIKYAGVEATANQFLAQSGFTLEDIIKAFSGDMAFMVSNFRISQKTMDFGGEKINYTKPEFDFIFNMKIADVASYNKIAAALTSKGLMEMKNGRYVPKNMEDAGFLMNGKNLIFANSDSMIQQYLAGKGNPNLPKEISSKANGKPFSFFADIHTILKQAPVDSSNIQSMNMAKATFKDFSSMTEKMNGNSVSSHMELRTMNEKENSLVSLINFFAATANELHQRMRQYDKGGMVDLDSIQTVVPDTAIPH